MAQLTQQVYVAEEWVKEEHNKTKAKAQSHAEVEKILGKLRQDQAKLSE